MTERDKAERLCLLDETKVCDDCGECNRCDLDPNKICDNCCKCLALEDGDDEFRTVTIDGKTGRAKLNGASRASQKAGGASKPAPLSFESGDEPTELTPELVAYWEQKLMEYGEAPADDGFGEIAVSERVPVKGVRKRDPKRVRASHFDRE